MWRSFKFWIETFKIESRFKKGEKNGMPEENQQAFQRLFLAVPVPELICHEIARAQRRLRRDSPPGTVRWAAEDQFHVTLKFLGDIPTCQIPDLKKAVAEACAGFNPISVSAGGLGFFPSEKSPRVIWVGLSDESSALGELQRRIHLAVLPFSPADTAERFVGHITLGRIKPGKTSAALKVVAAAEALRARSFGSWAVDRMQLVRSVLTPLRASHETVGEFLIA